MNQQMIMSIGLWVVVFAVFYFILIRPQKKKEQKLAAMRNALAKGDTVVTIGGLVANVAKVEEDRVILELGPSRTKVPYEKWAIGKVVEKKDSSEVSLAKDKIEE